jgi:gamma-glutamyltranspeptidase/glutathione hydrolase
MNRGQPSRREFLQASSAAIATGGAARFLGHEVCAEELHSIGSKGESSQAVATSRREAGEAARDILLRGGNAVDAAVAALMALCVVDPGKVSFGGYGGSMVVYLAKTRRVHAIDFTSRAPLRLDLAKFNAKTQLHGYLAASVPGIFAGIDLALREFGLLPFKTVAEPAIALAENGVTITPYLALLFARLNDLDEPSRRAFFPGGKPKQGAQWAQPDLAQMLRKLSDDGPASFYTGDIADRIVKQVQDGGGVLEVEDFREFRATAVDPLRINYRGFDLFTPPLPSGGLTTLTILKTLEQFDLSQYGAFDPNYIDLFIRAANVAWAEREQYFGDPEFVTVPTEELLSEKRAAERAERIRRDKPVLSQGVGDSGHTINVVVVDRDQNVVSWTATNGDEFGAHVAIEGLGLIMGHGMSRFALEAPHPNFPEPGKRPQHNMVPVVMLRGGKPYGAIGMPGGLRIVTVTGQIAANMIDFKATPQRAVSAPRFHTVGKDPILVSVDMPPNVTNELRRRGHDVQTLDPLGGEANAAIIDARTRQVTAAASKNSTGVFVF